MWCCCKVKLEGVRGPPTQRLNLVVEHAQIGGMLGRPATEAVTSQVAGVIACFQEALDIAVLKTCLVKALPAPKLNRGAFRGWGSIWKSARIAHTGHTVGSLLAAMMIRTPVCSTSVLLDLSVRVRDSKFGANWTLPRVALVAWKICGSVYCR